MDKKNDPPDELVKLQHEIARDAFFERHFDRILYGGNLKYAPARHLVKGVDIYGNENLSRGRLRAQDASKK